MNRIVNLFKKTHDEDNPPYPQQLERHYRVSKKVLGVGSFAVVKECTDRATGQPYALKIILKKAIAGELSAPNWIQICTKQLFFVSFSSHA